MFIFSVLMFASFDLVPNETKCKFSEVFESFLSTTTSCALTAEVCIERNLALPRCCEEFRQICKNKELIR